ncbi:hypothetical protein SynMEDNS5_02794 [Synechococcus sp. MEDNS5]|nr:hypothetical protein SynMEDNS5_02794 [Synechococcus sp. MEDNS5]
MVKLKGLAIRHKERMGPCCRETFHDDVASHDFAVGER